MSKKPPNAPKGVDPAALPTEDERVSADALRRALEQREQPAPADDDAALARRLRTAWSPPPIDPEAHHRILAAALAGPRASRPHRAGSGIGSAEAPVRRARLLRVAFGASAALALAASVAAVVRTRGEAPASVAAAPEAVAVSRSTQPLFADRFPAYGGQTSRVDRIALARATDLRDNEFSRWGIR
jgi:hypothetical protein